MANTFVLESKLVTMTVENLKIVDLVEDASPRVLCLDDRFEINVDVLFKPSFEPLLDCLLDNHTIDCYFGIESIGPGNEIQIRQSLTTRVGQYKYTIRTGVKTPRELGLSEKTIYMIAVGVLFQCAELRENVRGCNSLISGFDTSDCFFVA